MKFGFITIHQTKRQSKQWIFLGKSTPKKPKAVLSAGKVMARIFLGFEGNNPYGLFGKRMQDHRAVL